MKKKHRVLIINPKADATAIALYENEVPIFEQSIIQEDTKGYSAVSLQAPDRTKKILDFLLSEGINLSKINAVAGRGGLLKPIKGGTYMVNNEMLEDLRAGERGEHASNLGGIIAADIASGLNIPAFIVDPVVVDELDDVARISGYPLISRKSVFHALNHKACGRRAAMELGKRYEDCHFIVAHLGDGITIGAHKQGRVIDVNNGLNGEGPFSPERAGSLPHGDLIDLCYSGKYSYKEMKEQLLYHAGISGYLNKKDLSQLEEGVKDGSEQDELIFRALAYQVAKEIGSASTVLSGQIDAIILTGVMAYSHLLVDEIVKRTNWIADVFTYPGENDMQSLANGCLRVLRGEEQAKEYTHKVGKQESELYG
ncbi:butyrate kinase [Niallia taxi]|uniref:butyrate kinase n=1 Tax=Niallia taxi TaxID=2499688 RepID=UPI002550B4C6|nr:butyrate kinase [Niallia taxi]MDK8639747.1 butyrate kinase [Niallia taxi]